MHNNQNQSKSLLRVCLIVKIRLSGYAGVFLMNVHFGVSHLIEC